MKNLLSLLLISFLLSGCQTFVRSMGEVYKMQSSDFRAVDEPEVDKEFAFISCAKRFGLVDDLPFVNGSYRVPMFGCMEGYGYIYVFSL